MRLTVLTMVILAGCAASAGAQTSRFEIGPVVRVDKAFIEADATGSYAVGGVATRFMFSRAFGVEGEITGASSRIERSYEGWFISYVNTPNPSREEIEALAPTARRSLGYAPGLGWSAAFVARSDATRRVSVSARAGLAARRYDETSSYTILTIPDGVDPARVARDFQDSSFRQTRGGLLFGLDVPMAVTKQLTVAPELRFVYGGPAQVGNKYRELGVGVRGSWRF
jgi:hypothetical protein